MIEMSMAAYAWHTAKLCFFAALFGAGAMSFILSRARRPGKPTPVKTPVPTADRDETLWRAG